MHLRVEGLAHVYPGGVAALNGVSLAIGAGETVAIVGQNGAGKTTLVKHFNGLLRPSRGRVLVGQADTGAYSPAQLAASVGYAFQNPDDQLFERTLRAEVSFGPRCLGWNAARIEQATGAALAQLELTALADRHPYDLGFGQRKLAALAAVLAMETPIVVLDEPTTGQDDRGARLVGAVVDALAAAGRTVVAVAHDIDFCAEHFARVIVMSQGRVLADGPAAAVLAEASLLAETDVESPQLVRLAQALKLEARPAPLTVESFVEAWRRATTRG
jgi:energy-coupling factor transport system ATP-binding protein